MHQNLTALTYHKVGNRKEPGLNVISSEQFHKHLSWLLSEKYTIVTETTDASQKQVMITFDDGYESIYTTAYPIMQHVSAAGIVFVIADYIGKANDWDIRFGLNESRHLDADQLKELHTAGWQIASHGCHHKSYTGLTSQNILLDMIRSRKTLEDLCGAPVTGFTPPFNSFLPNLFLLAEEAGYKELYLQQPVVNHRYNTKMDIIWRRMVYNFDRPSNLKQKIDTFSSYELYKENIIHFCANATIGVNALRTNFKKT